MPRRWDASPGKKKEVSRLNEETVNTTGERLQLRPREYRKTEEEAVFKEWGAGSYLTGEKKKVSKSPGNVPKKKKKPERRPKKAQETVGQIRNGAQKVCSHDPLEGEIRKGGKKGNLSCILIKSGAKRSAKR